MENGEKKKVETQWQERSERPVAARPMTKDQIEEFRQSLVASYKCEDKDIVFEFEKIFDESDEDRDDCIWLKYRMNTVWQGKPQMRIIYTIKLPIPAEVRQKAEQMRRRRSAAPAATPGRVTAVHIEEVAMGESGQLVVVKPRARPPIGMFRKTAT